MFSCITILNALFLLVCHAELNAILNKNSADIKGCTIYVALFPCNECSKLIIQAGIKEVIFYSDKYHDLPNCQASRKLLNMAGVKFRWLRLWLSSWNEMRSFMWLYFYFRVTCTVYGSCAHTLAKLSQNSAVPENIHTPLKVLTLNPSHPSGNSSLMGNLQCIHHPVTGNRNTHINSLSCLWKVLLEIINTDNIFFLSRQFKPKASKIVINFASIDGPPSKPIWSISSP